MEGDDQQTRADMNILFMHGYLMKRFIPLDVTNAVWPAMKLPWVLTFHVYWETLRPKDIDELAHILWLRSPSHSIPFKYLLSYGNYYKRLYYYDMPCSLFLYANALRCSVKGRKELLLLTRI